MGSATAFAPDVQETDAATVEAVVTWRREIDKVLGKNMTRTPPMNVERAIALAKEWVDTQGSWTPGFSGAHLAGGILSLPCQAPFPPYLDVDVRLLLTDPPTEGRPDLHEEALRLLGYDRFDRRRVEAYLAACAAAFDLAVAVKDRWAPFDFKLQPHVRPYIVEGAREMIDEGHHREAMFWIVSFLIIAHTAIQWCAPEQAGTSQVAVDALTADVGLADPAALQARGPRLRALAAAVIALADGAVDRLPA